MRPKRIIFMGTPEISKTYLQSLIDNKYNIIATYTQPPRNKGEVCRYKNLQCMHCL